MVDRASYSHQLIVTSTETPSLARSVNSSYSIPLRVPLRHLARLASRRTVHAIAEIPRSRSSVLDSIDRAESTVGRSQTSLSLSPSLSRPLALSPSPACGANQKKLKHRTGVHLRLAAVELDERTSIDGHGHSSSSATSTPTMLPTPSRVLSLHAH